MMIFNQRGSVILWLSLFGLFAALGTVMISKLVEARIALNSKDAYEQTVMTTAHSIAALFKEELSTNYRNYRAGLSNWGFCTGGSVLSPTDFLLKLQQGASGPCAGAQLQLSYFKWVAPGFSPQSTIPVGKLLSQNLMVGSDVNQTKGGLSVSSFNLDPKRNQVILNYFPEQTWNRSIASSKNIQMIIDVANTLNAPRGDRSCHLCRAIPGSVCCNNLLQIAYVERGSGRIMQASFDEATKKLTVKPDSIQAADPIAITVKLGPPRINYNLGNFCVPAIGSCPTMYIVDGADNNGGDYFLTSFGRILDSNNNVVANVPTIRSIAYDGSQWILLRSDGAILTAADLSNPSAYSVVSGFILPTAVRLAAGVGPPHFP